MAAGIYHTKLRRHTFTPNTSATTGQEVPAWVASGSYYWASVDETNGRRSQNYGATETGADVEIRIRNFPTLAINDVLEDGDGLKFHVDQIRNGTNELICDCHRFDTLDPT